MSSDHVKETRAAACPDPALHENPPSLGAIQWALNRAARAEHRVTELTTEPHEAHADLEASRAREQIAAERVAKVLALCDVTEDRTLHVDAWTIAKQIRAILAGDQGEEARADG